MATQDDGKKATRLQAPSSRRPVAGQTRRQPSPAKAAASASDPEKARDRLVTWRAALLSGAVILLAGFVGAASSYLTATRQIESQAAQAQDDFLRGQRQEVYSEFLTAVLSAREKVDIIADRVSDGPTMEEQIPALIEDLNAVTVLSEEIQLIGGDGTRSSAATLTKHLEGYAGRKVLGGYCRVAPDGVAVQWWCNQAAYSGVGVPDTFTEGLRVERERFIDLAAVELQGG